MDDERSEAMGIAELARRAGVTVRTIRYYVAEGLLPPSGGAGQRRTYGSEHLARLRAIQRLKQDYLPLSEIRRRLQRLSPAELQRLAEAPALATPAEGFEYTPPIVLPPSSHPVAGGWPHPFVASAALEPPEMRVGASSASPILERPKPSAEPGRQAADATPSGTVWHRVALAPGVELHYQLSGDPRRDAAVARLVRDAARLFEGLPPGGSAPHLGFR